MGDEGVELSLSRRAISGVTATVGDGEDVPCSAWVLGGLGLLAVVVPVTRLGRSLDYAESGRTLSASVVVHLPGRVAALGHGICWGGIRNESCWVGQIVFNRSEVTVQILSSTGASPYSVTAVFDIS